jgi:hypothetical protein
VLHPASALLLAAFIAAGCCGFSGGSPWWLVPLAVAVFLSASASGGELRARSHLIVLGFASALMLVAVYACGVAGRLATRS